MSTWQVGDGIYSRISLRGPGGPVDADQLPTVRVYRPDGTEVLPALLVEHPETGEYRNAPVTGATPGTWTFVFSYVTGGTGQVEEQLELVTSLGDPAWEVPAWAPTLRQVATHIPTRTRETGTNDPVSTFTTNTYPTDEMVTGHIGAACRWVLGKVGAPLVAIAHPLCQHAASLYAAYLVERGQIDADAALVKMLRDDAVDAAVDAGGVNVANGGGGTDEPGPDDPAPVSSSWSFPEPPAWADRLL